MIYIVAGSLPGAVALVGFGYEGTRGFAGPVPLEPKTSMRKMISANSAEIVSCDTTPSPIVHCSQNRPSGRGPNETSIFVLLADGVLFDAVLVSYVSGAMPGIPTRTSTAMGCPARVAGLNFQRQKAATAARSAIASNPRRTLKFPTDPSLRITPRKTIICFALSLGTEARLKSNCASA